MIKEIVCRVCGKKDMRYHTAVYCISCSYNVMLEKLSKFHEVNRFRDKLFKSLSDDDQIIEMMKFTNEFMRCKE